MIPPTLWQGWYGTHIHTQKTNRAEIIVNWKPLYKCEHHYDWAEECKCVFSCVCWMCLSCLISTPAASVRPNTVNLHYRANSQRRFLEKRLIGNVIWAYTQTQRYGPQTQCVQSLVSPSERQQVVHYFLGGWVQKRRGSVRFTAVAAVELWTLTCLALMSPHQMQPDGCMWSVCCVFLSVCGIHISSFPPCVRVIHIWIYIYCVQFRPQHFGRYDYLLLCWELDERMETKLIFVH